MVSSVNARLGAWLGSRVALAARGSHSWPVVGTAGGAILGVTSRSPGSGRWWRWTVRELSGVGKLVIERDNFAKGVGTYLPDISVLKLQLGALCPVCQTDIIERPSWICDNGYDVGDRVSRVSGLQVSVCRNVSCALWCKT